MLSYIIFVDVLKKNRRPELTTMSLVPCSGLLAWSNSYKLYSYILCTIIQDPIKIYYKSKKFVVLDRCGEKVTTLLHWVLNFKCTDQGKLLINYLKATPCHTHLCIKSIVFGILYMILCTPCQVSELCVHYGGIVHIKYMSFHLTCQTNDY